jgi:hypothetical protein
MKTKFVKGFESAMKKLSDDVGRNQIRFYTTNDFPGGFPGLPPDLLRKCTSVRVAISACSAERRDYMLIAPNRLDRADKGSGYCHDMDPFIAYFDSESGKPCRTDIFCYHGRFRGRSEPVKDLLEHSNDLEETVATLKEKVISSSQPIDEVDDRIKEAMHFMADVFRSEIDGEES